MRKAAATNRQTLLQVLLVLACITKLCYGFNVARTALTSSTTTTRWQQQHLLSLKEKRFRRHNNCSLELQAHQSIGGHSSSSFCRNINYSNSKRSDSDLFPQRQHHHHHRSKQLILQMANDTSNNDVSEDNKNPLVRIWLKLRTFMSKLWVSVVSKKDVVSVIYLLFCFQAKRIHFLLKMCLGYIESASETI